MPYIYNQVQTTIDNEFVLRYAHDHVPSNSLLYFLPTRNSVTPGTGLFNKLVVAFPTQELDGSISYTTKKSYNIMIENNNGSLQKAGEHALIANRLAIFRFIKGDSDTVILINSPYYNNIGVNNLVVTNDAIFYSTPVIRIQDGLTVTEHLVATKTEIADLQEQINDFKNRILYGEEDPDIALASAPNGTVYIKVEE
jgi:hypothetical protein